jgi:High-affinity nickel-transport protein
VSFDFLFAPVEELDAWLTALLDGAPFLAAVAIAFVLGLRHASDPDHLVAVASLVAAEDGNARAAVRLGAHWGLGHAATLLLIGLPLIALGSELPAGVVTTAETAVGVMILALAARLSWRWLRNDYGDRVRSPHGAFAIGLLHGLAGSGAVVLLLIATLPTQLAAAAALAAFAPMSIVSMAGLTGAFAWVLTRPAVQPAYRAVLVPALGGFGLLFGLWYIGLTG